MKNFKNLFPVFLFVGLLFFVGCEKGLNDSFFGFGEEEINQADPAPLRCGNGQIGGISGSGPTREAAAENALYNGRLQCWILCRDKTCTPTYDGCTLNGVVPRGGTYRNTGTPTAPHWVVQNVRVHCDCACEECDETKKLVYAVIESTGNHTTIESLYLELQNKGKEWCQVNECNRFKCRPQGLTTNPQKCDAPNLNVNVPFGNFTLNPVFSQTGTNGNLSGYMILTECDCGCEVVTGEN